MMAKTQAPVKTETKPLNVDRSGILQRKCDCGKSAGLTGQCNECQIQRFTQQPGSIVQTVSAPVLQELIQPKLRVGEPGDRYEQEADRVADQVMRMPEPQLQRACPWGGGCPKCHTEQPGQEHESLQTKRVQASDTGQSAVPPIVNEVLRSPGKPLDQDTQSFFGSRFGHDFSDVRVHDSDAAAGSADAIRASAYTVGSHVVFARGEYSMSSEQGQRLLAHELTHVLQQKSGGASGSSLKLGDPSSAAEHEADAASRLIGGAAAPLTAGTSVQTKAGVVQRSPATPKTGKTTEPPIRKAPKPPPVSRTLRVTIVGHASPRWRDAPTNKEADRLNEMLANKRAEAVQVEVERILRQQLGQDVRIDFNVSLAPEEPAKDIEVGASGVGSRESITAARGDRQKDDEYYRRVDVDVEMVTTDYRIGGRSLPSEPALSKQWRIKINELKLLRAFGSAGGIEIEITNKLTGKQFLATAKLHGVARPKLNPFSTEEPTGNSRLINMDVPIGIQDFEGTEIAVNRVDAKLLLGESVIYITFPNLAPDKGFTMYHKFGIGMPSGYHVWGNLHVFGDPSDFYFHGTPVSFPQAQLDKYGDKTDYINPTEEVTQKLVQQHTEGLIVNFPTESYNLSASAKEGLNSFISTWTRRLGRTSSPLTTSDPGTDDLSPATIESIKKAGLGTAFGL